MNDKITFPRLASMLADRSGRSKRFSEDFLREFFALISETLEAGESVKVKGLGTFRLARVEPRKSVDVTTGQPMEISGHAKVVFIPAKELAEAVNSPFEAFTAIEISDDTDLSQVFSQDEILLQQSDDIEESEPQDEAASVGVDEQTAESADRRDHSESIEVSAARVVSMESEVSDETAASDETYSSHEEESYETVASDESDSSQDDGGADEIDEHDASQESYMPAVLEAYETGDKYEDAEDEYDEEFLDPKKFRRKRWKRILMISLGAALFALIATFAVWYFFATNDFNRIFIFNRTASNTIQTTETGYEVDRETPSIDTAASELEITDEKPSETEQMAEEPEVPTAPSDALVYDTVSTTRYLTSIAKTHYGNYNLWPFIYEENKAILGHPDRIRPGTPVVVPKLSKYGIDPSKKEDVEKAKKMGVEIYARYGKKI